MPIGNPLDEITKRYGPWTAHNLHLGDEMFTISARLNYDTVKLRRVIQALSDMTGANLESLRVLDLGVLEGLYTIELGLQDVKEAVGVEAREANLRKAEFSKAALAVQNIRFCQDDVRNVTEEKYGRFDVILCLGLLYHLDELAVFQVLERLSQMCDRFLVIDTHVALESYEQVEFRGSNYFGKHGREFKKGLSVADKAKLLWSAVDNDETFLLSKKSLVRVLGRLGFSSVFECLVPFEYVKPADRVTLFAVRGKKLSLKTFPRINGLEEGEIRKTMLEAGGTVLGRENPIISTARKSYRAMKHLLRRATAESQNED